MIWIGDVRKWNLFMLFNEWTHTLLIGKSKEGILILVRTFPLCQKKVILAFIKRTVDHFYHKCVSEYWLIG